MFENYKDVAAAMIGWLITSLVIIFVASGLLWMSVELWRSILGG